ncbi:MAG: O-antigen ligase family protein [Vicinamibacteria bacterium]
MWPSRLAEGLLIAAIVLAPWPYGSAADASRFALAAVVLAVAALALSGSEHVARATARIALAGAVLPAIALLHVVLGRSVAPAKTLEAGLLLVAFLAAGLTVAELARARATAARLTAAVLVSCGAQAAFGAWQWAAGPQVLYGARNDLVSMPFGSYVNHNHFAGLVEMGVILAAGLTLGLVRRARGASPAALAAGGLTLALAAVHLASQSRGGLVALGVGALVILPGLEALTRGGRLTRGVVGAVLAAALVIGFGWLAVSPAARLRFATLTAGRADSSGSYRLDVAAATLRLALDRPVLGSGIGAFDDALPPFKLGHGSLRVTHAESDVLEWLAEAGIVGAVAMLWPGALVVAAFRARAQPGRDPLRRGVAVGAFAAAATLLVHAFVDFNFRIPANALVWSVLLGLAVADPRAEDRLLGLSLRRSLAAVLALLALGAGWRAAGAWRLDRALASKDPNARIEALGPVVRLHPLLSEARLARGRAWRDLAARSGPMQRERLARAESDLRAGLRLRPQSAAAWADLGWVRVLAGDRRGGEEDLNRAVALDPTHWAIRQARAEYLARTGRLAEAIADLQDLSRLDAGWTSARSLAVARRWTADPTLLAQFATPR